MTRYVKPNPSEIEISVFGPGIGECVVVHLGSGKWMVVDSCIDPENGKPVALNYLSSLGVDIRESLELIVVSHWHDDHIKGISSLLKAAPKAGFVCSSALNQDEFYLAIGASEGSFMSASGVDEFREITYELGKRKQTALWAQANMCLHRTPDSEVHSLSPSPFVFTKSLKGIGNLIPKLHKPKGRAVSIQPNDVAVALWIEFNEWKVLLGADLERGSGTATGWKAIVSSSARPPGKAHVFKIPHHGSSGAHESRVWNDMLDVNPLAIVTAFNNSLLPKDTDLIRLLKHTANLFCTSKPLKKKSKRRDAAVEKIIRRVAPDLHRISGKMGHVRVRGCLKAKKMNVEYFDSAYLVKKVA